MVFPPEAEIRRRQLSGRDDHDRGEPQQEDPWLSFLSIYTVLFQFNEYQGGVDES